MEKYRIDPSKGMEFGIYTLGDHLADPRTGERISAKERIQQMVRLAELADQAGIDFFSVGESHQPYFASQAHAVILAAIAQATEKIKIGSSSTILSTSDPVRVYENFATLDLISNGRAEIIAGRASRVGLFELLGYDLQNYEALFEEKFDLLLQLNEDEVVNWSGEFRRPLRNAEVLPRPVNGSLPIWRAVGGTPASAIKAGYAGVPMTLAMLGGPASVFKQTIDTYREALAARGFDPTQLPVATTGFFYAAETTQEALRDYYPHINEGMKKTNGQGFPKQLFAQGADHRSIINVGSSQQIIEKILYQHEQFGHQRYLAQLDFGGVPFEKMARNIEYIGTEILPAIKKYTKQGGAEQ
ncbi:LLM class flavin-dependent oxidoreductase [Terribacillus saccharophilus]|uniref:LLM class flavin-dependent oxidoreductase n=1 Tax=Terribacillus saccharophilus TaxID=361277 RepID=A0A268ABA9_9BACI|nr:LLM class flavin-dependent oxidoreductase [Terribacillus saccharophilus]PAD21405.1 LLM class flavin-dependent oxidoreductase [Terribacillus saccharophilus]PAF16851.1 LLM class flavin-dependent oxidoreductase [Terribacillus saccharophilus]PAF20930.1 LLM class flavin-dependent oxidoreductase [Terribacillus saccharophilus]PAF36307.1 LLM class flavin-dependent oxidoreductase [Terribacillus saccharophilus]PAF39587.1 LLM class flavin-dependent oxidoreductase [Terribacillus saccharophilus]